MAWTPPRKIEMLKNNVKILTDTFYWDAYGPRAVRHILWLQDSKSSMNMIISLNTIDQIRFKFKFSSTIMKMWHYFNTSEIKILETSHKHSYTHLTGLNLSNLCVVTNGESVPIPIEHSIYILLPKFGEKNFSAMRQKCSTKRNFLAVNRADIHNWKASVLHLKELCERLKVCINFS